MAIGLGVWEMDGTGRGRLPRAPFGGADHNWTVPWLRGLLLQ